MRPPCCALCDRDFGPDEGGLVSFHHRPSDIAWEQRAEREGWTGHPPHMEWFCGAHIGPARDVAHLPIDEALRALRAGAPTH